MVFGSMVGSDYSPPPVNSTWYMGPGILTINSILYRACGLLYPTSTCQHSAGLLLVQRRVYHAFALDGGSCCPRTGRGGRPFSCRSHGAWHGLGQRVQRRAAHNAISVGNLVGLETVSPRASSRWYPGEWVWCPEWWLHNIDSFPNGPKEGRNALDPRIGWWVQ